MPPTKVQDHRSRWWISGVLVMMAAVLVTVWIRSDLSIDQVTAAIAGLNAALVLVLMALLPVCGFSIGIVYVVAGIKFGPFLGGVAVAGATAVHLLVTHWICQTVLRAPVQRFMKRRGHALPHIPKGEDVSVAAMAALVPGPPYFVRNYLLALSGVPLRIYFWVCLPIYLVRSYVAILIGDLGSGLNVKSISILASVYAVKLGICAYLIWRIRKRFKLEKKKTARMNR